MHSDNKFEHDSELFISNTLYQSGQKKHRKLLSLFQYLDRILQTWILSSSQETNENFRNL
jgi:hypothetical protein